MSTAALDVEDDMTGLWVALAAIGIALVLGAYRMATDGRFRGTRAVRGGDSTAPRPAGPAADTAWAQLGGAVGMVVPGERATLVQFSSAFCAPCRVTRRVLVDVAEAVPGVVHLEIDAEHHLDVVRRLGILRTPTTLVLDAEGRELVRAAGAPRKDQVMSALPAARLD
jgi:thiol-disulfide isomerase/thioredoxin